MIIPIVSQPVCHAVNGCYPSENQSLTRFPDPVACDELTACGNTPSHRWDTSGRYFERKTAREIGERLGLTEEAAQKRSARALDRLRGIMAERGLVAPATGLAAVLSIQAVQAAPVGLTASVIAAGTAETITSATSTIGLIMFGRPIRPEPLQPFRTDGRAPHAALLSHTRGERDR